MRKITLSEYNSIPKDYRGIWTVERWDLPNWAEIREKHMGKRTMMVYDKGTCLLVEGLGFEIVDDSIWKKYFTTSGGTILTNHSTSKVTSA